MSSGLQHSLRARPARRIVASGGVGFPSAGGWAVLCLSVGAYVAVRLVTHQPFHEGTRALRFFDLRIYRDAAQRILNSHALYRSPMLHRLGFTYPPFAALVLLPLAYLPLTLDEIAVTGTNVLLLVLLIRRTLLLTSWSRRGWTGAASVRRRDWSRAALIAAAALWLEPVTVTLGYGQIDLLIAALVLFDLSRPDSARSKGVAIGIAAAIKLTPLVFILYLLLSGRRRAAAVASAVFGGSIAVVYATLGGDASAYWGGVVVKPSRIGRVTDPADQSLRGAIARLLPHAHAGMGSDLLIAAVALLALSLAIRASRRGDEAAGFSFAALCALLASPISWTHHWTLAVPALLLLACRAREHGSKWLTASAAALALVGYAYLPERVEGHRHLLGAWSLLTSDPYVVAACLALGVSVALMAKGAQDPPGL